MHTGCVFEVKSPATKVTVTVEFQKHRGSSRVYRRRNLFVTEFPYPGPRVVLPIVNLKINRRNNLLLPIADVSS